MVNVLCALASCRVPGREHADGCDEQGCLCLRARARDGGRLCEHHTQRISDDLLGTHGRHHRSCADNTCSGCADTVGLADLYDELALRLAGGAGTGDKVSGTADTTRLPNPAAVETRAEIRHVLVSWCRLVAEERGFALPADTVHTMADYIARSSEWLAATDYADEAVNELNDLRRRAFGLAYPSGTRVKDIAPCPVDGCAGTVRAVLRRTDSLLPSMLACDADDGHAWRASEWHAFRKLVERKAA